MLALLSGALLHSQQAQAAQSTFYGVNMNLLTSTSTPTDTVAPVATATDTPVAASATATDTPAATATDTPAAASTNTPTPATATATATPAPTATPKPTPVYTGTAPTLLDINAASTAVGVQQNGNWCGIATIALIANYLGIGVTQDQVAGMITDPSSTSEWGMPPYNAKLAYGPGVTADISRDFGTDPRSIAEGLTLATGWQYHAKVDTAGAWDATKHIVWDLMNTRQPISVFVDHGQHSVVVFGVSATKNPMTYPSSITGIWVWDPGGGKYQVGIQPKQIMEISLSTWLYGITSWTNFYGSDYFKYPYASNVWNGLPFDPDPAVGPYTYISSKYNHLWIGHYVWVSAWGGAGLNADWELNQYGALIAGLPGSGFPATPPGYTGSVVPMPNNIPPPPPPVQVFTYAPLPKPHPKPVPKPTPRPTSTPRPTPRRGPSPTPDLPWPPTPTTAPSQPEALACASAFCMPGALPPGWVTLLVALFGALLLSGVLLYPRRARLARIGATLEVDGAGPQPMPPAEPPAPAAVDIGPVIVPVLEAEAPAGPEALAELEATAPELAEPGEPESPTERAGE